MDKNYLQAAVEHLRSIGVEFEPGLSDEEVENAQRKYFFQFPPDLRMFLQTALPISILRKNRVNRFPNWRDNSDKWLLYIYDHLNMPLHGICIDIAVNYFWKREWGEKPTNIFEAFSIARRVVAQAPFLIPVYSQRFMPTEPAQAGNPVFSIYQTTVIYSGNDLASFLHYQFKVPLPEWASTYGRDIPFWSDLEERNNLRTF